MGNSSWGFTIGCEERKISIDQRRVKPPHRLKIRISVKIVSCYSANMIPVSVFVWAVGVIISFATVARGAHDIWAATAVYLTILTLGVVTVFHLSSNKNKGVAFPLWPALTALVTIFFLSYFHSVNPSESYLELMDWFSAIIVFFIAANILRSDCDLNVVLGFVVVTLWFEAIYCSYQFYSVWQPEKFGSLINANALAAFVIPWIPIFLSKIILSFFSFNSIPSKTEP
jgi:hypothetical protein